LKNYIVILYSILFGLSIPAENYNPGLLFTGRVNHQPRTQLNLSSNAPLELPDDYALSFETSFHTHWLFGYLFNLVHENGYRLSLTNQSWAAKDSVYFHIIENRKNKLISLPLPSGELQPTNWQTFSISISATKQEITLAIEGKDKKVNISDLPGDGSYSLVFGFDPLMGDVCHTAIRNIVITSGSDTLHYWPLNEFSGDMAANRINPNYHGMQQWGEWQSIKHSGFSRENFLQLNGLFQSYGEKNGEAILLVSDSLMVEIDPMSHQTRTWNTHLDVPTHSMMFYYDKAKQLLYRQYRGRSNVSRYNINNESWSFLDSSSYSPHYYGTRQFMDENNHLYLIGGYGWFTIKGHIQKYNFQGDNWDTLQVEGLEDYYRIPIVNVSGFSDRLLYFGGGQGNKSGKQEFGYHLYHDLWSFDPLTLTAEKIWESNTLSDSIQFKWLQMEAGGQSGVIITTTPVSIRSPKFYQIQKFNITDSTLTPLIQFQGYKYDGMMFHTSANQLVYYNIEHDSVNFVTRVKYSSINWPVLNPPQLIRENDYIWYILGILALVFVIYFWILLFNKRNKVLHSRKEKPFVIPVETSKEFPEIPCYIQVFNEFKIVIDGRDIAHEKGFTLQNRRFLAYLILKGYQHNRWISFEKFSAEFWEEGEAKKLTNRRTTLLSRIRPFFKSIPELPYLLKGENISFNWNPTYYVNDLHFIWQIIKKHQNEKSLETAFIENYRKVVKLIGRGNLLTGINDPWVEQEREFLVVAIQKFYLKLGELYRENGNNDELIELAKSMLAKDPYDTNAIQFLCDGYEKTGQKILAKKERDNFVARFESEIGEKPEI